ncbi:MAG: hypothetical protein Sw1PiTSA_07890 [Shewanella algae]|nr:hypothetical protein AYI85_19445 [Shewanella algae]PSS73206.1 hypothetical protein AYI88_08275 [Shewanella algae]TVK99857.1 hypothetical protein AYI83_02660 [Shewanella algae]
MGRLQANAKQNRKLNAGSVMLDRLSTNTALIKVFYQANKLSQRTKSAVLHITSSKIQPQLTQQQSNNLSKNVTNNCDELAKQGKVRTSPMRALRRLTGLDARRGSQ